MQHGRVVMRILMASAVMVVLAGGATAQSVFRQSSTYPLTGATGDATSLFALVDVGSSGGPLDGILDVVAAEPTSPGVVTVLFGNGDGTFNFGSFTQVNRIPTAMAVADFNGDGFPDLLVGDFSDSLGFFAGSAAGSAAGQPFALQGSPIPAGVNPVAIVAADVNGDGKLDAIVVDEGNEGEPGGVTVLLGAGDGTFTQFGAVFPADVGSAAVAVADFDGDGKLDLAVVNKTANNVTIMYGAGTGFFTTKQTVAAGQEPIAIAAADLNGDGRPDLVVYNDASNNIAVFDGSASSGFGNARFFATGGYGSAPAGLALGDVNKDGILDAIVPNSRSSDASVLLGDGHGNFGAARAFVTDEEPVGIAVGDVDGDGVTDVVTVNQGTAQPDVAVLISRGAAGINGVEDVITQPSPSSLVAGDVDNDGVPDLIVAHNASGTDGGIVLVYRATPPVGFAAPSSLQSAGDAVAVGQGDFNADGRLDIAVVNNSPNNVSVFLGQADGGFGPVHNYPIGTGAAAVAVGDWNHDGRSDLAIAEQGTGPTGVVEILLAAADGSGRLGTPTAFPVGLSPISVDFGDFDEDGKPDLAVANNVSGTLSILKGNGDGTFTALSPITGLNGAVAVAAADFDRDHHVDLAVASASSQNLVNILFGNGQGGFTIGRTLSVSGTPSAVAARDISGDSIPDLLVADSVSNAVALFTSLGTNRHFSQADYPSVSRRPVSVVAGDFDGDGRYDAAALDAHFGAVSVMTNMSGPTVLRGDGNGDKAVSAADLVAVMRELADGNGTRIEEVTRVGSFAASPGVDANGDGVVTPQDALAVAHRLFPGSA